MGVAEVRAVARQLLHPHQVVTQVRLLGTYTHPTSERPAQTYEISYSSHRYPLGPKQVDLQSVLAQVLAVAVMTPELTPHHFGGTGNHFSIGSTFQCSFHLCIS